MAKYNRFDPRNKKHGNHKSKTLTKDFRIREVNDGDPRHMLMEIMYDDDTDREESEHQILQG